MTDINGIKILKKRGRKPKNKISEIIQIKEDTITSEKEVIIVYLPINLNDMETKNNDKEETYWQYYQKHVCWYFC